MATPDGSSMVQVDGGLRPERHAWRDASDLGRCLRRWRCRRQFCPGQARNFPALVRPPLIFFRKNLAPLRMNLIFSRKHVPDFRKNFADFRKNLIFLRKNLIFCRRKTKWLRKNPIFLRKNFIFFPPKTANMPYFETLLSLKPRFSRFGGDFSRFPVECIAGD